MVKNPRMDSYSKSNMISALEYKIGSLLDLFHVSKENTNAQISLLNRMSDKLQKYKKTCTHNNGYRKTHCKV